MNFAGVRAQDISNVSHGSLDNAALYAFEQEQGDACPLNIHDKLCVNVSLQWKEATVQCPERVAVEHRILASCICAIALYVTLFSYCNCCCSLSTNYLSYFVTFYFSCICIVLSIVMERVYEPNNNYSIFIYILYSIIIPCSTLHIQFDEKGITIAPYVKGTGKTIKNIIKAIASKYLELF